MTKDHSSCHCGHSLAELLAHTEQQAQQRGERMTPLRREVLTALTKAAKPIGAYDLLDQMNTKRPKKVSAMSLYRTLDFFQSLGAIIKLESRNSYMPCFHTHHAHGHIMTICDECGFVEEVDAPRIQNNLLDVAKKHNMKMSHNIIELHGLCAACQ